MTAITSTKRIVHEGLTKPRVKVPSFLWPEGLTWFIFRTWVALALGMYAAFFLEIGSASTCGVCILILAQPAQGMVLSKSIYRFSGTVVGALVALTLTALFPQDRTMLLASFAVFMGLQTALGSILRDFRSYGCILAGYTVAIISITDIDNPNATFSSAVNRVAAIFLGIVAIAIVNSVLATAESSQSLTSKLRTATKDVIDLAVAALDQRERPDPSLFVDLSARLMPLRGEISYATPERAFGRARAAGARSALLGLLEMLSAIQAVGAGLSRLGEPSETIQRAISICRKALRLQKPEACAPELEALALPLIESGRLSLAEAHVLDRMHAMIETLAFVRDGQVSLRTGIRPRRNVQIQTHTDWFAAAINATRVTISIAVVSVLSIWSSQPNAAQALLYTAVFVSLGAVQPNPNILGYSALFGMPAVVVAGSIYAFFVFPVIDGYPLFILSYLPLVIIMCWLIKKGMGGAGLIFGVQTFVLSGATNFPQLIPLEFASNAEMLAASGLSIFLTLLLVFPVDPRQRRMRLALAAGKALRRALADEGKLSRPRASLQYDRLAQFKTWQGKDAPTPARGRTMRRLVDLGNLALAVRRTWRALDRARPNMDPEIDARARRVLPTLSPDDTFEVARTYLQAAAHQKGRPALDLTHAAAALYGTALVTSSEARLLQRIKLYDRAR